MILRFLIEKEFKLIARNSIIPKLIIVMPVMMMLLLPWAANMEVRNINLSVVDNDQSPYSERLVNKVVSSGYFHLVEDVDSYDMAMHSIESGAADVILEIPQHFQRQIVAAVTPPELLVAANAVNGTKGSMGAQYLASTVQNFGMEIIAERGQVVSLPMTIVPQYRYNVYLEYKYFMVPALMVMLLTIMCGFMPAMNIVSEKEVGTIEQMNVSPVSKFTFIVGKLIPYWMIGFIVLTLCFGLAWVVYGIVAVGSLWTIYVAAMIFLLLISGLGLVISNYSQTMQQAMFVMFFFLLILLLLSGLFTPVNSMPGWAQWIAAFNPLKYFIQVMRGVYLKGSTLADIQFQLLVLGGFAVVFNLWAVVSYHKKG